MKTLSLAFTLVLAFMILGCDETKKVIDVAGNVQLSGAYNITSVEGIAVPGNSEKNVFISFAALDKSVRGNTGCNTFFGNYTLDLYALSFKDIAVTEMACEKPVMDIEQGVLAALRNTGSYGLQNNILTLYSKNDRSVLLTAQKDTKESN
ncbi:META domain-containing protein [Altibacter sp.]|uniref:META domain-containing protein n=1 Tax=Altibacter sp. TaxID=2024823 RepID=UPI000C8967FA|nr:META domain-containing protein [Altibacter sp.]MAP53998.1 hypothetical protein [Altibacter sp.]